MADDWDAVDQEYPSQGKAKVLQDSWDAVDAPDSWDAPVSNGNQSKTNAKDSKAPTGKNASTTGSKAAAKSTLSGVKGAKDDKAIERARIELSKARDVADLFSSDVHGEFELLQPSRKEEFDLLQQLILTKLSTCKNSKEFNPFIESLFRKIANELDSKTLKAVNGSLVMIAKDKELAEKAEKAITIHESASSAAGSTAEVVVTKGPAAVKKAAPKPRANIKVGSVYDSYGQDDAFEDDEEFDDEFSYNSKSKPKPVAPAPTGGYYDDEGEI